MQLRLILFGFLFLSIASNSNAGIKDIYLLREKGKEYQKDKKFDSARICFSKITADATYANATDYINLSYCCLLLKDTAGFKQHLIYSIEHGGADSAILHLYLRPLDSNNQAFFKRFFNSAFPEHRAAFLKSADPLIEREMKDILYLDQICRRQVDQNYIAELHAKGDTANDNFKHIKEIGHYIDSVNYERVAELIKQHRYPGFHNFGINSSDYSVILMHISDHNEEQWNFIFDFLKREVMTGDIMPNEVVAIATRHYQHNRCTYYGTIKWGLTTPCDCDNVDKFRSEIGLDSLKQEYKRLKQQLPACYHE